MHARIEIHARNPCIKDPRLGTLCPVKNIIGRLGLSLSPYNGLDADPLRAVPADPPVIPDERGDQHS